MWRRLIPRVQSKAEKERHGPLAEWLVLALVVATLAGVVWVFTADPRGLFDSPRQIEYRLPSDRVPPPTP